MPAFFLVLAGFFLGFSGGVPFGIGGFVDRVAFFEFFVDIFLTRADFVDAFFGGFFGHFGELGVVFVVSDGGRSGFLRGEAEQNLEDFLAERALQAVEEFLALAAVFDERIALADGAPVDTFTQVLHIFEVLHPEGVEDLEVDFALDFSHDFFAHLLFLGGVGLLDSSEGEFFALFGFSHAADGIYQVFVEGKLGQELFFEFFVDAGGEKGEVGDGFTNQAVDFGLDVFAHEDFPAHEVDDATVAVDDVVILDDVFAAVKIESFDAFLSGF